MFETHRTPSTPPRGLFHVLIDRRSLIERPCVCLSPCLCKPFKVMKSHRQGEREKEVDFVILRLKIDKCFRSFRLKEKNMCRSFEENEDGST